MRDGDGRKWKSEGPALVQESALSVTLQGFGAKGKRCQGEVDEPEVFVKASMTSRNATVIGTPLS